MASDILPPYLAQARSLRKTQMDDCDAYSHSANLGSRATVPPSPAFEGTSGRNVAPNVAFASTFMQPSQLASPFRATLQWMSSDPFLDALGSQSQSYTLSSKEDHSMPDYSHSTASASNRSATGANDQVVSQEDHDDLEEMLEAYSPPKASTADRVAAASSRKGMTALPLRKPPPSAAAEARAASYSGLVNRRVPVPRPLPVGIKGTVLRGERLASDTSMGSRTSEEPHGQKENQDPLVRTVPATTTIKGREEGKGRNELETPQQPALNGIHLDPTKLAYPADGLSLRATSGNIMAPKRKRSQRVTTLERKIIITSDPISGDDDDLPSSPTRKFSKGIQGNCSQLNEAAAAAAVGVMDLLATNIRLPLGKD